MTDREAFEKWIVEENPDRAIDKYDNGAYADWDTENCWDAWQAACKYKDEQIQSLCHIKVTQG